MYLADCHPQSSLKQAVKAPLEVRAFRLQGKWTDLPEQIRAFQNLEILLVKGCGLERLPGWLSELPLKALNLSNNPLRRIVPLPLLEELEILYCDHYPEGLENLLGLRRLALQHGSIEALGPLPPQLHELSLVSQAVKALPSLPGALKVLRLSYCQLTTLPALPQLTTLDLSNNPLETLPPFPETLEELRLETLGQTRWDFPPMPHLKNLQLSFNAAPLPALEPFPELETLFACDCHLTSVPDDVGTLRHLGWLNVNVNRLKHLPETLQACHELKLLYAKANLLRRLPDLRHLPLSEAMLGGNPLQEAPLLPSTCQVDLEDAGWTISPQDLEERVRVSAGLGATKPLVPLRIPGGWTVVVNQFREDSQTGEDGTLFYATRGEAEEVRLEARDGLYQLGAQSVPDWAQAAALLEQAF